MQNSTPTLFQLNATRVVACFLLSFASCSKELRTRDEIFQDQLELPAVYLTVDSQTRVIASQSKGLFVDETTGELAWPALACHNPDCPARGPDDEPHLFIAPNPAMYAKPDGSVGYDQSRDKMQTTGFCPECLKGRNQNRLTQQDRDNFVNWVKPHVLPETAERIKELDAERKRISERASSQ